MKNHDDGIIIDIAAGVGVGHTLAEISKSMLEKHRLNIDDKFKPIAGISLMCGSVCAAVGTAIISNWARWKFSDKSRDQDKRISR